MNHFHKDNKSFVKKPEYTDPYDQLRYEEGLIDGKNNVIAQYPKDDAYMKGYNLTKIITDNN